MQCAAVQRYIYVLSLNSMQACSMLYIRQTLKRIVIRLFIVAVTPEISSSTLQSIVSNHHDLVRRFEYHFCFNWCFPSYSRFFLRWWSDRLVVFLTIIAHVHLLSVQRQFIHPIPERFFHLLANSLLEIHLLDIELANRVSLFLMP